MTDRTRRQLVDIAASPEEVEAADLVVLHRVVCCYPDAERLLGAAADRCRRRLAFSHPPRNLVSRSLFATQNAGYRVTRKEYRVFAHPPADLVRPVAERGLTPLLAHRGMVWHVEGLARSA
jgi:magnesium-protoporphyrin O-methyltransferase